MYKVGLWTFIVIGLFILGFNISLVVNASRITAAALWWRLLFIGESLTTGLLIWLSYQAVTSGYEGRLNRYYWIALSGSLITLVALMGLAWSYRKIPYGRRTGDNPHRRRDDDTAAVGGQ